VLTISTTTTSIAGGWVGMMMLRCYFIVADLLTHTSRVTGAPSFLPRKTPMIILDDLVLQYFALLNHYILPDQCLNLKDLSNKGRETLPVPLIA